MAITTYAWLAWDGSRHPNGELNKHGTSQTREPVQGKGPRFVHKVSLSFGRTTYTLVDDRSVSVRVHHLDPVVDPTQGVLAMQLKLSQEHLIQSLLLRIVDETAGVVLYQEALDALQLAALDHGAVTPALNWRATQLGNGTYSRGPLLDPSHQYKVIVWVSQAENAFAIRSEGTARLIELTREPPSEYGYQVSSEYNPSDSKLRKRYRREIRNGTTTLVQLQQARQNLVLVQRFAVAPPLKIRLAMLNPNTSYDTTARKKLVFDIATRYAATPNDPLTWAPYAVGNRLNTLQGAPHVPVGTDVSCPHFLDPDANFDSWKWRVRYLLDKIAEVDANNILNADGNDVLRVMVAPEWFFAGTQSVSRFAPGLPPDTTNLGAWAENVPAAPAQIPPRVPFTPAASVIRPYTEQEKDDTIQALQAASANHPQWLIIPGTILWKKPRHVPDPMAPGPQYVVFNTAVAFMHGNVLHTQHKLQHGGDATNAAAGYGQHGSYHGLAWCGRLDPALEWANWVGPTARNAFYGAPSLIPVPNCALPIGLDICADHGMYRVLREYSTAHPNDAGLGIHFVISAGKPATDRFSACREGGFVIHCDSSGLANRSGIKRVVRRAQPFQGYAQNVTNWWNGAYNACCVAVGPLNGVDAFGLNGEVAVLDPPWVNGNNFPAEHGTNATPMGDNVTIHIFDRLIIPGQAY